MRIRTEQLNSHSYPPPYFIGEGYNVTKNNDSAPRTAQQTRGRTYLLFMPSSPVLQTNLTYVDALKADSSTFNYNFGYSRNQLVGVTYAPTSLILEKTIATIEPDGTIRDNTFLNPNIQSPPLDSSLDHPFTDYGIFLDKGSVTPNGYLHIALRTLGINTLTGIFPNTSVGMESLTAEIAEAYGLNYPSPETARIFSSKKEFHDYQQSLGLRVPEQSEIVESHNQILQQIELIGDKSRSGKIVIKPDDRFGSEGYFEIPNNLAYEEKIAIVNQHLLARNKEGSRSTIVEEFMKGIEVGCHITTSGGKIHIDYTRKTMSKGSGGNRSEEIEHYFDPQDPIFALCQDVLTPKITKILKARGAHMHNMSYNADAILDERYFHKGKVIRNDILEEDNSYINEMNCRMGGAGISRMFGHVYRQSQYPQLVIAANMGDSNAIEAMDKAAEHPQRAGLIRTFWPYYEGYIADVPRELHPAAKYQSLRHKNIIFSTALDFSDQIPGLPPGVRYLPPIGDWHDKDNRRMIAVFGNTLQEARVIYNEANALSGVIALRPNGIYYTHPADGRFLKRRVKSKSELGTYLKYARGMKFDSDGNMDFTDPYHSLTTPYHL